MGETTAEGFFPRSFCDVCRQNLSECTDSKRTLCIGRNDGALGAAWNLVSWIFFVGICFSEGGEGLLKKVSIKLFFDSDLGF